MQDRVVRSREFPYGLRPRTQCPEKKAVVLEEPATSSSAAHSRALRVLTSAVGISSVLSFALLTGPVTPQEARGQTAGGKSATATQPNPAETVPLRRYVTKENLIVYMEFAGLDAHESAWRNTAACKMLNDTSLGVILEDVSGQLLDKALAFLPGRRLSGPEVVKLVKGAAKSGWVFALRMGPKATDTAVTVVVRGVVTKELKPLSSRLMGWLMGSQKYKIERKDGGRTMVVVPFASPQGTAGTPSGSWVWWPEKNDLVIASSFPTEADRIIAALDGKAPTAVDHPVVQELKKREGSFEPVCVAFVDIANSPSVQNQLTELLHRIHEGQGVERIDLRWGFDAEALMSVTTLVAPKPWKSALAAFDQPTFEKTSLMPMPDSVESFVELSISPSKILDLLEQMGPAGGEFRAQIEQLSEAVKTAGSIDLKKDVLGHLGPRMVAYLAPGRSATTNDDSLEAAFKTGLTTTAAVTAMQSFFPKLTVVAEVDNPEAFGKGLDTAMIAINNELKAQALEKEAEDRAAAEKAAPGGAGRSAGGGADRTKRRRSKEPSYPHFQTTIGQAKTQNDGSIVKSFVLITPTDSALRFGPSSFRPTVLLEDKYVAFAVSSDAARAAVAAAKRKDWKPSSELTQAYEKVPSQLVMLSVSDVRESLSSLLSSLPGTLQTMINTSIALAKARAGAATASNGTAPGVAAGMSRPMGGGAMTKRGVPRGARLGGGGPVAEEGGDRSAAMSRGGPPGPGGNGSTAASDSMIVLKVDPDKLPKAADLKAQIFPTTFSISVAEREMRIVSRGAFPDLTALMSAVPVVSMMPAAQEQLGRLQAAQAATTPPGTADSSATAPGSAASAGTPKNAQPPGPGGRRSRRPD